ncbi:DUF418 domain-containing protein [Georgenia sp. H159]|uniref:DUF418 domain-containing protein n=1 Tax=Georgenia sp. H159 TaxID=3076115 RepID=UPI002D78E9F0|nr:DUF418 domain-containing protein [Georgenia sp. H159]
MTTVRISEEQPARARLLAPDLARGLMLALIAVANVMIYLHDRPYGLRQHIVEDGLLDRAVTAVVVAVVDGRAYPLFAALFGYGLVRLAQRQRGAGTDDDGVRSALRRRSRWLLLFGLVHALAGFSGDVLGWYGLLGLVLAGRLHLRDRTLLVLAAGWLVLAAAVQGLVHADPAVTTQRTYLWSFAIADPLEAAAWRLLEWVMTPVGLLAVASPMLVGVWAARRGVLEDPARHRTLLRRTAVLGIGAGLVGGVGMALATVQAWTVAGLLLVALSWLHVTTGVLCGLGYAAAIALLAARLEHRGGGRRVVAALRAAGARSLSCYLAQTAVFAALLPAWSLGWGARLGTAGAAGLALATWTVTVLLATVLDRRGRRGPAEALLRRLSRSGHFRAARARATIG